VADPASIDLQFDARPHAERFAIGRVPPLAPGPDERRPILVTGAHRSGTTWVGRIVSLAPGVGLIHEPFNPLTPPGVCAIRFDRFFRYICDENEAFYYPAFRQMIDWRYNVRDQLGTLGGPADLARAGRDLGSFLRGRVTRERALLKDPIAVFSSEWLASRFGAQVVVMVRHPAAFTSSLKKYNWRHRFEDFLDQPLLLRDHLGMFEDEIREFARHERDIVSQGALLWRMIYRTVLTFQERHPDWIFVRHEDMSRDPLPAYDALFARLGLQMTERVRREVEISSGSENPVELRHVHDTRLDSKKTIYSWKRRLSEREIETIRIGTADVSPFFYGDDEW
jgi:hypothetical protein